MTEVFCFVGTPSGDGEDACWDVSREDFVRLAGREPHAGDASCFRGGLYRLYRFAVGAEALRGLRDGAALDVRVVVEEGGGWANYCVSMKERGGA